ncbi:MAG: hypothetical protein ACOVJ8_08480 [Sediminibacterium sp.]
MITASQKDIISLVKTLRTKGYQVFDRPYELNIVGIRKNDVNANNFDDGIFVFWKDDSGNWVGDYNPATTDPGTYWLKNPMNVDGTAILKEGQYINAYRIGKHKGQYDALVQVKPVTVIRDYDRNAVLDFNNGKETTGLYGINIHRSALSGKSQNVDKWSAGCQVFQIGSDFEDFMKRADKHRKLYGNTFTYTLIDERAYSRNVKRRGIYVVLGVALALALFSYRRYIKLNK